jgi:hypothetical protein
MNRRKFITLVGTWSLGRSWRAQQSGRIAAQRRAPGGRRKRMAIHLKIVVS